MSDGIIQMRNFGWISCGSIVCLTLSLALLSLNNFEGWYPNPAEEMYRERPSGAGFDKAPGPASHAPLGHIPTMFGVFKFQLKVEVPGFPVAEMEKTDAWAELQKGVTAYGQELEFTRNEVAKEERRMSDLLDASYMHSVRQKTGRTWLATVFTLGAIVFMLLDIPNMRRAFAEVRAAKAGREDVTKGGE